MSWTNLKVLTNWPRISLILNYMANLFKTKIKNWQFKGDFPASLSLISSFSAILCIKIFDDRN